MKSIKFIISLFVLGFALASTFAAEMTLNPTEESFGEGCLVPVEIVVDTYGKTISATDIIMESSLEFIDFVPGDMFPYFLPPKVVSNVVHIVGFAVDVNQRVSGKGVVGTAYFKQSENLERESAIRLYFEDIGETIDSNLSIPGGVDVLEKVVGAYYTFVEEGACEHASSAIEGGIYSDDYENALMATMNFIADDTIDKSYAYFYRIGLGIIIVCLIVFYLGRRGKGKK